MIDLYLGNFKRSKTKKRNLLSDGRVTMKSSTGIEVLFDCVSYTHNSDRVELLAQCSSPLKHGLTRTARIITLSRYNL